METIGRAIGRGVIAGLVAGIPQVLVVQVVEKVLGLPSEKADIGPRFVERLARKLGTRLDAVPTWSLAALFHFGYSAWWGALYGLVDRWLRPPPILAGPALGAIIYLAAFSRWGGATQTETETHPDRRPLRESILHLSAVLSFSLTCAYGCRLLRGTGDERRSANAAGSPRRPITAENGTAAPVAAGRARAW